MVRDLDDEPWIPEVFYKFNVEYECKFEGLKKDYLQARIATPDDLAKDAK